MSRTASLFVALLVSITGCPHSGVEAARSADRGLPVAGTIARAPLIEFRCYS